MAQCKWCKKEFKGGGSMGCCSSSCANKLTAEKNKEKNAEVKARKI